MNLFQLVLKQMRQRALGTTLTLLSVMLGVGLAVSIMILSREAKNLFGQNDYGYDILVGAKGSPLQLVLNTVYHLDKSPGNIPYSLYEDLAHGRQYRADVKTAIPIAVGDSYMGHRIVATMPKLFGYDDDRKPVEGEPFQYRPGHHFEFSDGQVFRPYYFEAVIGSDIPKLTGLHIGSTFKATHGLPLPGETPDIHPVVWTVVGVLKQTHTADDRVLFISLPSFYTIAEHEAHATATQGLKQGKSIMEVTQAANAKPAAASQPAEDDDTPHYTTNPDGSFALTLPKAEWEVSGVLIKSRGAISAQRLLYVFLNNGGEATAVNPATVMREFFDTFLKGSSLVLLLISALVTVVAAVGILVSIYNSVSARLREIAILRALGATRTRVLLLICVEAGFIGLFGGLLGLVLGHAIGAVGSAFFDRTLGETINYLGTAPSEWLYLLAVIVIAVLAGLVPAMKAYRTPVATNLVVT